MLIHKRCTDHRWVLPELARKVVLDCCLHDDGTTMDLQIIVVMPDHVHLIFTPLVNEQRMEVCSLAEIMDAIKGASAHKINKILGRKGRVWQTESFDHVLRCSESLDQKIEYIRQRCGEAWFQTGRTIPGYGPSNVLSMEQRSFAPPDSRGRLSLHEPC